MNKFALRIATASAAAVSLIALAAGTALATPYVSPGDPAPIDNVINGEQLDANTGTLAYQCMWLGPGIGFGSNPAGGVGPVSGLFFASGTVQGVCMDTTNGGLATGIGWVE
ncbi:hypothetical protein [Aldersonia kunmingensis]|uniref:hypothetical protein n=1 Tax=Aldersonia kunmingensis TaxID=408066 RepID=UPI00082DFFD4|nr:hypothetical protein [Aldersonia kunmingensis]